jgi:hypothetical protein
MNEVICADCKQLKINHARGMCQRCYNRIHAPTRTKEQIKASNQKWNPANRNSYQKNYWLKNPEKYAAHKRMIVANQKSKRMAKLQEKAKEVAVSQQPIKVE